MKAFDALFNRHDYDAAATMWSEGYIQHSTHIGPGRNIYAFREVLPTIERHHPVIAVDLPGFGRSEGRSDVMSPEGMGRFIVKLAEHFGMNRLHAVGPDVGTSALLFAAAQKQALFESLIVGSGAASVELTAGALKDLVASPPGAFAQTDGGVSRHTAQGGGSSYRAAAHACAARRLYACGAVEGSAGGAGGAHGWKSVRAVSSCVTVGGRPK